MQQHQASGFDGKIMAMAHFVSAQALATLIGKMGHQIINGNHSSVISFEKFITTLNDKNVRRNNISDATNKFLYNNDSPDEMCESAIKLLIELNPSSYNLKAGNTRANSSVQEHLDLHLFYDNVVHKYKLLPQASEILTAFFELTTKLGMNLNDLDELNFLPRLAKHTDNELYVQTSFANPAHALGNGYIKLKDIDGLPQELIDHLETAGKQLTPNDLLAPPKTRKRKNAGTQGGGGKKAKNGTS